MCRSAAEGGQRCHSDAIAALERAEQERRAAATDNSGSAYARWIAASEAVLIAQEDLASTRTGLAAARARLADRSLSEDEHANAEYIVETGEFLRERNAALRVALADQAQNRPLFGGTGDAATDQCLREIVAMVAANPDRFRTAVEAPIRQVKTPKSAMAHKMDVTKRTRAVVGAAHAFTSAQERVQEAHAATPPLDETTPFARQDTYRWAARRARRAEEVQWAEARRDDLAAELLLEAHRLHLARAQTPPV